jgi:hypothetical protein
MEYIRELFRNLKFSLILQRKWVVVWVQSKRDVRNGSLSSRSAYQRRVQRKDYGCNNGIGVRVGLRIKTFNVIKKIILGGEYIPSLSRS